jgi:hypothetical protein
VRQDEFVKNAPKKSPNSFFVKIASSSLPWKKVAPITFGTCFDLQKTAQKKRLAKCAKFRPI